MALGRAPDDQQQGKRCGHTKTQSQNRGIDPLHLGHGDDDGQNERAACRHIGHGIRDQRAKNAHADKQHQPAFSLNQREKTGLAK